MEKVRRFFSRDRFAARNGIELVSLAPGYAKCRMSLQEYHLNGYDTVHGGAIFTLADFAFAAASNSHGNVAVAINASISFLKACTTGTLWAEAREVARHPKLASYTVEVRDEAGELAAIFQGMVYRKSEVIPD